MRLKVFGEFQIVIERELCFMLARQIAGITDRGLTHGAGLLNRLHGHIHILRPIEGIEDAENIDARIRGAFHKILHHIVRIVRVADRIRGAQQHLQRDIRRRFAKQLQPPPWVFFQEAHGDVKSRATPAFQRKEIGQTPRIMGCGLNHVVSPHARRQKRLMRVAHGRVGNKNLFLLAHPLAEGGRTELFQLIAHTGRDRTARHIRQNGVYMARRLRPALYFRIAVDIDISEEAQKLCCAVLAFGKREQLRRLVDEPRRILIRAELRMIDEVCKEDEISGDAANAELVQSPRHAIDRFLRRRRPGGHFLQQRVIEPRHLRTRIGRAAVEADAKTCRAAIGDDTAVIGNEVFFRILCGHPALQGVTIEMNVLLRRDPAFRRPDRLSFRNPDLRLDDVNAGDLFGHRMLHLDARIDLDKIEGARLRIH